MLYSGSRYVTNFTLKGADYFFFHYIQLTRKKTDLKLRYMEGSTYFRSHRQSNAFTGTSSICNRSICTDFLRKLIKRYHAVTENEASCLFSQLSVIAVDKKIPLMSILKLQA